jgi:hypothetical protein
MLIENDDGTHSAGPLDLVLFLYHEETQRFHVAFFEESPLPGPVRPIEETTVVRLKSKMHHTAGAQSWEEAQTQLAEFLTKLKVPENNIIRDSFLIWDGQLGKTLISPNWLLGTKPELVGLLKHG